MRPSHTVIQRLLAAALITLASAGTAVRSGSAVTFTQSADTFVRNLTFSISGSTLQALNQTPGGATFSVILTRQ